MVGANPMEGVVLTDRGFNSHHKHLGSFTGFDFRYKDNNFTGVITYLTGDKLNLNAKQYAVA